MNRARRPAAATKDSFAVFLDRDGVLLELVDHLHRIEDMRLTTGITEAIRNLNVRGIPVIVVTNQSVVGHGLISESGLRELHKRMTEKLAEGGARLDAIYYCPHHPQADLPTYRIRCTCRKPAPGMILAAARDFDLDLKRSILIGDTLADIEAAQRAGIGHTILVRTGHGAEQEMRAGARGQWPNAIHPDAPAAIAAILDGALCN